MIGSEEVGTVWQRAPKPGSRRIAMIQHNSKLEVGGRRDGMAFIHMFKPREVKCRLWRVEMTWLGGHKNKKLEAVAVPINVIIPAQSGTLWTQMKRLPLLCRSTMATVIWE